MRRFRSTASNRIVWMTVLTLSAAMFLANAAVAQKKSSSSGSSAKATPQKTTVKPPPARTGPATPGTVPVKGPGGSVAGRTGTPPPPARDIMNAPHPPPGVTRTANGVVNVKPNGDRYHYDANNKPVEMRTQNMVATYGQNGRPSTVVAKNPATNTFQAVHHGPGGIRTAEAVRPAPGGGQLHVVSTGPKSGYLERPVYNRPGFVRRSYLVNGRQYAVVYRGYHYRNVLYYRPVPVVVYSPAYYGWAVQSYSAPVVIQLDFASQPWYGSYGNTFTPYQQYSSTDQWMTDQILASNMQAAYAAGQQPGAQQAGADVPLAPPAISPELKQQFDAQVKQELTEQGQQAQGGVAAVDPKPATANEPDEMPDALKPGHTVFRVVATLDVESDGDSCKLNTDDWIVRNGDMDKDGTVAVTVAASRSSDCAQGSTTRIALNDLMTMQSEEDQQIQNALKMASLKMGTGGMPAGPPAGAIPVPGGQAQPDVDVASNLQKEQLDANAVEAQAVAPPAPGGQ